MSLRSCVLLLPLSLMLACGDSTSADGSGDGSSDGPEPVVCPDIAPAQDDPCDQTYATCTYMECTGVGVTTATCRDDDLWDIQVAACGETFCHAETCAPGFVCVVSIAGFPQGTCVENPCGDGPIGCGCPGCPDGANGCTSSGLTLECNTCHAEMCA